MGKAPLGGLPVRLNTKPHMLYILY